jgi:hypothetical protein
MDHPAGHLLLAVNPSGNRTFRTLSVCYNDVLTGISFSDHPNHRYHDHRREWAGPLPQDQLFRSQVGEVND